MSFFKIYESTTTETLKGIENTSVPKFVETGSVTFTGSHTPIKILRGDKTHKFGYVVMKANKNNAGDVNILEKIGGPGYKLSPGEVLPVSLADLDILMANDGGLDDTLNYFAAYTVEGSI